MKTFSIHAYYSIGEKEKAGGGRDKKELSRERLLNSFEKFDCNSNLQTDVILQLFKWYFRLSEFNILI